MGPEESCRPLRSGRRKFVQRTLTTLIWVVIGLSGYAEWTHREEGIRSLQLLDALAHPEELKVPAATDPEVFVDEYLAPGRPRPLLASLSGVR
jgi:hypothetical protein